HPNRRKTRFRLLARLYRTGLVTRRVPAKGFRVSQFVSFSFPKLLGANAVPFFGPRSPGVSSRDASLQARCAPGPREPRPPGAARRLDRPRLVTASEPRVFAPVPGPQWLARREGPVRRGPAVAIARR